MKKPKRITMSVREMGRMLGLGKTESYWLVHRRHFETTFIQGVMRVKIDSFEHWYANQIKYRKIGGPPPGAELREYSYSIAEMAELLGISDTTAYTVLKQFHIETFKVDTWMRIRKDIFESWYKSQSKYRTNEDRMRDAELEQSSMTFPQMARQLGITRKKVYQLIASKSNQGVFEIIVVADRKRVTIESFERWYQSQDRYKKVREQVSNQEAAPVNRSDDSIVGELLVSERTSFTVKEAALLIGVSQQSIYRMIKDELLDSFYAGKIIRIRREALLWWLSSQQNALRKEVE